jgi:fatty acid amide hydrolase
MYTQLGDVACAPAVRRAVTEAADALRAQGAHVEPFQPPDVPEAWRVFARTFYADGLRFARHALKGATVDWRIRTALRVARIPTWLRPILVRLLETAGQSQLGDAFRVLAKRVVTTPEYLELVARQRAYRRRFDRALQRQHLDAIVCPVAPSPAILHGEFHVTLALIYTALYNLLGLPAGAVSITRVRENEQSDRIPGRDLVQQAFSRIESQSFGLPVGVQVVARWWREDIVLAVMSALEQHFRQRDDYPHCPPQVA